MPTETSTEKSAKAAIQKLQRAIVDGLEDVKALDIQVFDTEHLSALFERVIIASGTSNRQTKALAASVRDAVREAGFPKPRIEGEENGEWIIVDCGPAVVHIMQPAIRQYYTLEDIWGEKPVRMRIGKAPASKTAAAKKPLSRTAARTVAKKEAKAAETAAAKAPAESKKAASKATKEPAKAVRKPAAKTATASAKTTTAAAKPVARKPRAAVASAKTTTSTKTVAKKAATPSGTARKRVT
ncbi:MAG: ribosome silencing factor [Brachymonas sp.]|nr:ribosome silencing factor [Brachymonas sp.]